MFEVEHGPHTQPGCGILSVGQPLLAVPAS